TAASLNRVRPFSASPSATDTRMVVSPHPAPPHRIRWEMVGAGAFEGRARRGEPGLGGDWVTEIGERAPEDLQALKEQLGLSVAEVSEPDDGVLQTADPPAEQDTVVLAGPAEHRDGVHALGYSYGRHRVDRVGVL